MNELQIFENAEFGKVRTLTIDNEPYFVGKDVAEILGYAKARNAIASHVDDEDKKDAPIQGTLGGVQEMTVINESGLYSLILSSKLPTAKKFKRWVTSEVLPTIRKTGGYQEPKSQIDILVESAKALQRQERELARLRLDNEEIRKEQGKRIDDLNGVCTDGTKRQRLVALVNAYARKSGVTYDRAWRDFKVAYNTAFHTSISLCRANYVKQNGLTKKPSVPEFLEAKGLLGDALRIADKLLNSTPVA